MAKQKREKIVASLLVAILLTMSLATAVSAATVQAPVAQQLRDKEVRGTLPGGQFAKFWLGLEPEQSGAQISVIAEWDRPDAIQNGVGFFILDEAGLVRIGDERLSDIAIAAGDPGFILNGASNQMGASFGAIGLAKYTLVVFNDSATDANFTLTATNGFITDESNQVTGSTSAPATPTTETTTETPAETTEAAPEAPAATEPVTPTVTTEVAAPVTTTAAAPAPAAVTSVTPSEVRATTMEGDLFEQDKQHFLGLVPSQRDGTISIKLTFDPQDSSELARRLNFWVLDEAGLTQYIRGTSPGEVAIAAGNRTFRGDTNERVASLNATGLGPYTVIVYNNSDVPGSYTLTVEGGILIDDSAQTKTAQTAGAAGVATTGAVTTTVATTTTAAPAATPPPATTTTTITGRTGEPGGTYTVQSGDTLAIIARDIYGDFRLYEQLCSFNGIANCNLIEVGDVIRLPTLAQIQSGATATTTAPAATTTTTTQPATTTTVTPTTTVSPTAAVTTTATVTPTRAVTTTAATTTTATTTGTTPTTTTGATTAPAASGTLVAAMTADGRFTSLVEALQATGLDSVLQGQGPFTVFAPTDAAFAALPAGAFEQLLNDPGGQLTDILRYHVIAGKTLSEDLSNGMQATTVQGKSVRFEVQGNVVKINGATLVTKDIEAGNGVVHVIDAVILPPPE